MTLEELQQLIQAEIQKSLTAQNEIVISDTTKFLLSAKANKLTVSSESKDIITVNNAGVVGIGTSEPKTSGPGSTHIKAWYTSEAPIPVTGKGSTRGLLVESDSDDDSTFSAKIVSRNNRQGVNVTGNGKLLIGNNNDSTGSKLSVTHVENSTPVINLCANSKIYSGNLINIETGRDANSNYNILSAKQSINNIDIFKISGSGHISAGSATVTQTAYAEIFEWADGNKNNQDRTGYAVTLNKKGKLRVCDNGEDAIGVIVKTAALIGGSNWRNHSSESAEAEVVEWIDNVGILNSYYVDDIPNDVEIPDNAQYYKTEKDGSKIMVNSIDNKQITSKYGIVALLGSATVLKGQQLKQSWFKLSDVSDTTEKWFLR